MEISTYIVYLGQVNPSHFGNHGDCETQFVMFVYIVNLLCDTIATFVNVIIACEFFVLKICSALELCCDGGKISHYFALGWQGFYC